MQETSLMSLLNLYIFRENNLFSALNKQSWCAEIFNWISNQKMIENVESEEIEMNNRWNSSHYFEHEEVIEGKLSFTPGTAGGPGGRDRTLAIDRRKIDPKSVFFSVKKIAYIFYLCQSIGGNFHTWEIAQSWSKAKDGEKYSRDCGWPRRSWSNAGRKKKKKRPKISFS